MHAAVFLLSAQPALAPARFEEEAAGAGAIRQVHEARLGGHQKQFYCDLFAWWR